MINIIYNGEIIQIPPSTTIKEFLESIDVDGKGTGVAVNNVFIRQAIWDKSLLKEGDSVVVIRAAFGG